MQWHSSHPPPWLRWMCANAQLPRCSLACLCYGDHQARMLGIGDAVREDIPAGQELSEVPFQLFPDLLKELMSSWKDHPHSGRSAIPGVCSLNCDADVNVGTKCGHPSAPLVVCTLLSQPGLPLQGEQSALSEHAYRAAALNALTLILNPHPFLARYLPPCNTATRQRKRKTRRSSFIFCRCQWSLHDRPSLRSSHLQLPSFHISVS